MVTAKLYGITKSLKLILKFIENFNILLFTGINQILKNTLNGLNDRDFILSIVKFITNIVPLHTCSPKLDQLGIQIYH